jgi:8-oxo-dGTP diphosphatase
MVVGVGEDPVIRIVARGVIVRDATILVIEVDDGSGCWWILPGGRQEYGETAAEAVARECREELRCEVAVGRCVMMREFIGPRHSAIVGNVGDLHALELIFVCDLLTEPDLRPQEKLHRTIRWVAISELPELEFFPRILAENLPEILATEPPPIDIYVGDAG